MRISLEQNTEFFVIRYGGRTHMRQPLIAGILSLLIPGLGQIYNGRVIIGIIWLLITGFSWIGSAGLLGWVVHIIAAWCAYSYAKDNPVRV
jgi:TM2 domain-containing membrane protein YozV